MEINLSFFFLLFIILPIYVIISKKRKSIVRWFTIMPLLPRGSFGFPFIGETLDFISCAFSSCPESFMNKRRLSYGKVFKSHLFGSATIVSTDAEFNKIVLQSDAKSFVPWYPKSLTELMGENSILLINGSLHKRVHGLIGAFFRSPALKAQITLDMRTYVFGLMSKWQDDHIVYIQDQTKQIVFQILVKVLIGLEPGVEMQFLKLHFREFIAGLMSLPIKLPGSRLYRSLKAKKKMVELIEKIIKEKREKNNNSASNNAASDVIDVLIKDASDKLTDSLISDNMVDLMIPGEDSVPVLITLAIKYLSDCPLALKHLEEENMQLKEKKSQLGQSLQWTDYMSLTFTQDVITETLRLGNIISGIMRTSLKDTKVKGHFVPKGWCVFMYFRSVHLDESHYSDPHHFNPWRWKNYKDMGTCSFTPFGGGQRLCPGLDLARLEASIFLHHLVTNFRWEAKEDYVVNFPTVRMKRGMPIRIHRRTPTVNEW